MSKLMNVETVYEEIRKKDKNAPIEIRKNGKAVCSGSYPPGPLVLQNVKSYYKEVKHFLIFFKKVTWVIELL